MGHGPISSTCSLSAERLEDGMVRCHGTGTPLRLVGLGGGMFVEKEAWLENSNVFVYFGQIFSARFARSM